MSEIARYVYTSIHPSENEKQITDYRGYAIIHTHVQRHYDREGETQCPI